MADDESWLYGEDTNSKTEFINDLSTTENDEKTTLEDVIKNDEDSPVVDEENADLNNELGESEFPTSPTNELKNDNGEVEESDSDDDGLLITIDQNKIDEAKTSYSSFNKASLVRHPGIQPEKKGKFSVEEFDTIQTINGIPSIDVDIDSLEDKPWKKPGADITDYFNYGFTEDTWQAYCNRQKRIRLGESGVGMPGMLSAVKSYSGGSTVIPLGVSNGLSPLLTVKGGSSSLTSNTLGSIIPTTIAVMTSDKREYSKKVIAEMDFSVPPPGCNAGPIPSVVPSLPPSEFHPDDPFGQDYSGYSGGYEPTLEAQWSEPPPSYMKYMETTSTGDREFEERDSWRSRRSSRDDRRDHDRKRRRTRSRSRERGYRRDRSRDRDRERSRRSKSPSHKHKKSKKDKREKFDREVKKEIDDQD